jgi:hypothetical protein
LDDKRCATPRGNCVLFASQHNEKASESVALKNFNVAQTALSLTVRT